MASTRNRRTSRRLSSQSKDEAESSDSDIEELANSVGNKLTAFLSHDTSSDGDSASDEETVESKPSSIDKSSVHFVIDTKGDSGSNLYDEDEDEDEDDSEEDEDNTDDETERQPVLQNKNKKNGLELSSSLQPAMDTSKMIYMNTDLYAKPSTSNKSLTDIILNTKGQELMKKSILGPDLEKKFQVPLPAGKRKIKKLRREEKSRCKGGGWFDMKAPEMTDELKNDLMVLKMRKSLDRKQFYKGNDTKALPKFFQMGEVVDSPVDFYNSRVPKKQRKQTIVDELLADAEFRRYNKRKYSEIMETKMKKSHSSYKSKGKKRFKKRR